MSVVGQGVQLNATYYNARNGLSNFDRYIADIQMSWWSWIGSAAITSVIGVSLAWGQAAPGLDQSMRNWEALPENPGMREPCLYTLHYSTKIDAFMKQGATLGAILKWAAQESELSGRKVPADPLLPIGTNLVLVKLIRQAHIAQPVYEKVAGGFPQWAYKSCLKGRPIDQ